MELFGYVAAILMGLSLGIIGGGGSILTVPILVYFFRQEAMLATTGSLFVVGATAFLGALINWKRGLIDFKTGVIFAVPSFAGVFVSRKIVVPWIPNDIVLFEGLSISKAFLVLMSFAILMIFASRAMIRSGKGKSTSTSNSSENGVVGVAFKGFLVGCTTGFVGAGGGFLIIPALVLLLKLPMRIAVGTSLAIIAANSLFGFMISDNRLSIDWQLLGIVTAVGAVGLVAGNYFSGRFNEGRLKQGFGYFVMVIGLFILVEQALKIG